MGRRISRQRGCRADESLLTSLLVGKSIQSIYPQGKTSPNVVSPLTDSHKPILVIRKSKLVLWIPLLVLLSLIVSAFVGLQLFQDGSSYLLEILITHSAVRHERLSVLLFQSPTIFLIKAFHRLGIEPLFTLPIVRFAFNLNYALTPFVSLLLSWLVIRNRREELLIWAALIILFVNLVNFSWVSELLISVQFACPLLLALLLNPKSKTFWALFIFLTPVLFFLHPLVITIFVILAVASAYIAYRRPEDRRAATWSMILFLLGAVARGVYSFFTLSLYEVSFASSGEIDNYFVISRFENLLFLGAAVEIAFFVLLSNALAASKWQLAKAIPWLVSLQSYVLLLFVAKYLLNGNLLPLVVMGCLGIPGFLPFWQSHQRTPMKSMRLLYLACAFLAAAASSLLLAQYVLAERQFTLKMGLDLFVTLSIMAIAVIDSLRDVTLEERILRFRLVLALSVIFASVIIVKSIFWQISVQRLEQTLHQAKDVCVEMTPAEYQWLPKSPYTIINNWSLPSLALVIQDERPRKALLAINDCEVFYRSGMIQIDPWSQLPKEFLVPPLE